MPKGGARTRSGPAPDPNALSRSGADGWVTLPKAGRKGRVPVWPLPSKSRREGTVWAALWKLPQAVMWERLGQQHLVALYVRRLVEAEEPGSRVNLGTLVRQMADDLGLTSAGMARNLWRIVVEDEKRAAERPARPSAKGRLKLVAGGG